MTSRLLVRPSGAHGRVIRVTPETAGWTHVGFELFRLADGDRAADATGSREACLVLVEGAATIAAAGTNFGIVGGRSSPFDGPPDAVYVPAGAEWSTIAEGPVTLAVCTAPGVPNSRPPRLIGSAEMSRERRGRGNNVRYVTNILPESEPADSLLVVEVVTPAGNTSSYPPHKHDRDDLPNELLLEETYYHRLRPAQGFAFQRVYTEDRALDEAIAVEDGDVTLVPRGYHPCATVHGYDLYYLNVMAGPRRTWRFHNAAEHAWLLPS